MAWLTLGQNISPATANKVNRPLLKILANNGLFILIVTGLCIKTIKHRLTVYSNFISVDDICELYKVILIITIFTFSHKWPKYKF